MVKTELRYSIIHEAVLSHGYAERSFKLEEYKKLKDKSKKFEELYKKYIKRIIKLLEKKMHAKKWRYEFIPVYVVDIPLKKCTIYSGKTKSFWKGYGDPITILVRHEKVMLFTLIHELTHNLLPLKKHDEWGAEKTEKYIHYGIAQEVWDSLNLGDWRAHIKK